jgi:predicted TIM-barrel fold metal-dependent hydrolase
VVVQGQPNVDEPMVNQPVVDAHMHLWDLDKIRYPWLTPPLPVGITGDVNSIAKTYQLDDYLRDSGGETGRFRVAKVVHVEAGANPADSLKETRWLQSIADARGYPQALVAHAELNSPNVEVLLAEHASHRNVRGIRQILNWHPDPKKTYTPRDLLADPTWERGFALLRKYGLSFDLQIYPGQMHAAAQLAARHPDTPIILNHTGMPVDRDAAGLQAWRAGMQALAPRWCLRRVATTCCAHSPARPGISSSFSTPWVRARWDATAFRAGPFICPASSFSQRSGVWACGSGVAPLSVV